MIFAELEELAEKYTNLPGDIRENKTDKINKRDIINRLKEDEILRINNFEKEYFVDPVISIVSSLPKSNLAETAEALINLTALRKHVSAEEESVGGPTDVALITKIDGFVWIKRKA